MNSWLYLEINIFCILVVSLILMRLSSAVDKKTDNRLFMNVIISCIILFVFDSIWVLIDNGTLQVSVIINGIVNSIYMCMTGVVGFTWFLFTEFSSNPHAQHRTMRKIIGFVPLVALFILSFSSIWTGFIFRIDEHNVYHRGSIYFVQILIGYGYVIWTTVKALIMFFKDDNYIRKGVYLNFASFSIFPLIAGVIQTLVPGLPALCCGLVLALLTVFMTIQGRQISLDSLTTLNNRNQLNKYLSDKLSESHHQHHFYILMMDIDYFKKINDTYGHVTGDRALMEIAEVLKETCGPKNCFISRYGGDEFVVIYDVTEYELVEDLINAIHANLETLNACAESTYKLSMSIGCAEYTGEYITVPQLIALADDKLYEVKKNR